MKNFNLLFFILLFLCSPILAQEKFTLSGKIKDATNGEDLIGATILIKEINNGVASNEYGFYSITVPKGNYTVKVSYLGYENEEQAVTLDSSKRLDFELNVEAGQQLEEVVITKDKLDKNVKDIRMSVAEVDIKQIRKMPALLGEVDVIRSIQLLPGVSTVGEGASGFNVRGGGVDQNLVLLDEAPVYNSSHLFGFFSVFNPDAVKDVRLIKGGIPAQYGGRLSSILDVRLKEGNNKRFTGAGGVGFIFSRLTLEGPIVKDKGSFIIAARRSYIDVLAKPFLKGELKDSKFYFYDLTVKGNYSLGLRDKIFVSGYLGRDVFGSSFQFNWGNSTGTVRWNHIFNDKLFSNFTAIYSNYDYELGTQGTIASGDGFKWNSRIQTYSFKPDFKWYLNPKNIISFGGQILQYNFSPGEADVTVENNTRRIGLQNKYAMENAIYLSNEQTISQKLSLEYGVRYSLYNFMGKGKAYYYGDTILNRSRPLREIREFEQWESITDYHNFEPRFSMKFEVNDRSSIKASYNRTAQYIHLLSNTAASVPLDVWTPSSNNIKPQLADQYALGYFKNFGDFDSYETSVEVYYKDMQNQVDYIDYANLLLNEFLEADLLNGKGRAYGLELYGKKNKGKLTGWISYTLARSERQVNGINRSDWYPTRFDRLHNLNVVSIYELNKRWSVSANFTFGSGTPITFLTNKYIYQNLSVGHNPDQKRNNYRQPPYHRLDLSATLKGKEREGKKWYGEWVFSVYNVYNRRNPFAIYLRPNAEDPNKTEAVRFSVFGSFVPAVTYNFKF